MSLQSKKAREHRRIAPLLWMVPVTLCACSTDVEVFRSLEARTAATAAAAGSSTSTSASNSTNILIAPGSVPNESDGNCRPGHYVGDFNGTYNSAALPNGTGPLAIAATPSMGRPGLEFWLERIPRNCRSDDEFCADFTVKGGKIRGFANPFPNSNGDTNDTGLVVAIHFEIDFGGALDCSSGQFKGLLQNGCYDLATVLFRFEGDAPATYDPATSSFTDGTWTVKELPSADRLFPPGANIGGTGSWQASFSNDSAGPAANSGGLCDP